MRKRAFLSVLAMLCAAAPAAIQAAAGQTPPRFCTGRDCLADRAGPAGPCKGLDCEPPGAGAMKECSGQDCQPIPDQTAPRPEDRKVEPAPEGDGATPMPQNGKAPQDKDAEPGRP